MLRAGDVVIVGFAGAVENKRRPTVVLSNEEYHRMHPDVMLGVLTSNISAATTANDYVLQDWHAAGLRMRTAFRTYVGMELQSSAHRIGRLSDRDWQAIQYCVRRAME